MSVLELFLSTLSFVLFLYFKQQLEIQAGRGLGQSAGWVAIDDVRMTFGSSCDAVQGKEQSDEPAADEGEAINPGM